MVPAGRRVVMRFSWLDPFLVDVHLIRRCYSRIFWVFEDIVGGTVPRVPSRLGYSPMVPRSFPLGGILSISRGIELCSVFSGSPRCLRLRTHRDRRRSRGVADSVVCPEGLMFDKVPELRLGRCGVLPSSGVVSI